MVTEVELAVAVMLGEPHVLAAFGGEATRNCAPPEPKGKLSLTVIFVSALAALLLSVIVKRVSESLVESDPREMTFQKVD